MRRTLDLDSTVWSSGHEDQDGSLGTVGTRAATLSLDLNMTF